jgi:hypothetical protein
MVDVIPPPVGAFFHQISRSNNRSNVTPRSEQKTSFIGPKAMLEQHLTNISLDTFSFTQTPVSENLRIGVSIISDIGFLPF